MNSYIIDPSVFYWMNVLSIAQTVCAVIGAVFITGSIIFAVSYFYETYTNSEPEKPDEQDDCYCSSYDKERYRNAMKEYKHTLELTKKFKTWFIVTLIVGIILCLSSMFIPSKNTSIEMLVARTATFDNVDWTVAQVKEIIDYIVSTLKGAV